MRTIRQLSICLGLILCGCAAPHRSGISRHEHREYAGRSDGLKSEDIWLDSEKGGGWFLGTDPKATGLKSIHCNQTALGGGNRFETGEIGITLDPQDPAVINALGTAIGNVVGQALKTASRP